MLNQKEGLANSTLQANDLVRLWRCMSFSPSTPAAKRLALKRPNPAQPTAFNDRLDPIADLLIGHIFKSGFTTVRF
jgi:hypothetical protein